MGRTLLWALLAILAVLIGLSAISSVGFWGAYTEEVAGTFPLHEGEELRVHSRNGRIHYENWDGTEVSIVAVKETRGLTRALAAQYAALLNVDMTRDTRGVSAASHIGISRFLGMGTVHFHVRVPRNWTGDVSMQTSNGEIRADGLNGEAELRTSNGAITVRDHTGTLRVRTSNGRVEVDRLDSVLIAESSNGAIRISNGVLRGNGHVRTSNGAIELEAKLEPGASYEARTSNGRVTLTLVEPDVALDLTTSNGSINLAAEVATSQVDGRRLVGRIGEGAARLLVRTSNGSISLSSR